MWFSVLVSDRKYTFFYQCSPETVSNKIASAFSLRVVAFAQGVLERVSVQGWNKQTGEKIVKRAEMATDRGRKWCNYQSGEKD